MRHIYKLLVLSGLFLMLVACSAKDEKGIFKSTWETVETKGVLTARHEASLIAYKDKLYLIGGRRINPVDVYDPKTNTWTQKSDTPLELHHFQAVVVGDAIYLMGAMTGGWPNETPLEKVVIYYPEEDRFEMSHAVPKERRRGGAGVVVRNGKIYMAGGITNGHMNGYVNWFDEYDPKTGQWRILPDAPHARDHLSATIAGNKLYAFAGRKSEHAIGNNFGQTLDYGDIFDFETNEWLPTRDDQILPTPRAGNMAITWGDEVLIGGGESDTQVPAHDEVEAYNTHTKQWRSWPSLNQGRHGSGFAIIGEYLFVASGCGERGGKPELTTLERLKLPAKSEATSAERTSLPVNASSSNKKTVNRLWHSYTVNIEGPNTSETTVLNPFTDYRLLVTFKNNDKETLVRGFYAADGEAANTSAAEGNIWQARFTPDETGEWTYEAVLEQATDIATQRAKNIGTVITQKSGSFTVTNSDKTAPDFRTPNRGRLRASNGYFRFKNSGGYWLKGGPNSPENLLAFEGFDQTYRISEEAREGESAAIGGIHRFEPHLKDWNIGDPTWGNGKGRAIIGAMNYLSEKQMNTAYFLTLNILGDGKDVWPYQSPEDFTRFDVSKLEQWNILFDHMQSKGILLHVVIQETENELMLDGGDTGPLRSLYLSELISRFGHHPALIWNLGEENGPVHWRPEGQNDQQRKAMADYFEEHDPYKNPVLLHTHSQAQEKDDIAGPLLGYKALDGLSLQVDERETVFDETRKWRRLAQEAGHDWVLTMDEIGPWHMGAAPDALNPHHNGLRRHALWGHLLGGGAGVEWYFGAKFPSNDLTTEDWRTRDNLWTQTANALAFFETHLPYWEMTDCRGVFDREDIYCAAKAGDTYALYLPEGGTGILSLPEGKEYTLSWYDPISGGALQTGAITKVEGSNRIELGLPPLSNGNDWVLLIQAL